MTSWAEAGSRPRRGARGNRRPTWPRVAVVAAVFLFAFFVARSCQESQVRISEEQAIAIAEQQIDFEPEHTQIRLLRQGLSSKPFWFVVLSVPTRKNDDVFAKLAQYRVDANTGEVSEIERGEAPQQQQQQQP